MKTIQEYIEINHNNNPRYIDKSYLKKYDFEDMMIMNDCMNKCYKHYHLFEAHSVFHKCREISNFLSLFLYTFQPKESSILFMCDEIDELKNDYFRTITINYESDLDDNGQYDQRYSKEAFNDSRFDFITINIKVNSDNINDKIEHELTHAYDDLQRQINKADSLNIKTIKSKYNNLQINDNDSKFVKDVKNLLYLLDRPEQNAYLAQFDGILGKNKFRNIQRAYNIIYNSKLYKDIKSLSYLIDIDNDEINNNICELYRKLFDNNDSNNKILKYIHKEWKRFKEHFTRNIYQCVCDHIEINYPMDYGKKLGDESKDKKEKKLINKIKNEYIDKSIFIEV